MKINPAAAYRVYSKAAPSPYALRQMEPHAEETATRNEHTDQIQISHARTRKSEIEQLTKAVASEIYEPTSPEKLDGLRSAIQNKAYHVSTSDLAEAMMRHWFLA